MPSNVTTKTRVSVVSSTGPACHKNFSTVFDKALHRYLKDYWFSYQEVPLSLRPFQILFSHFQDFRNLSVNFASLPCPSLAQESRLQQAPVCASTAGSQGEDRPSPIGTTVRPKYRTGTSRDDCKARHRGWPLSAASPGR